jgi:hypothetical protein
MAVTQECRAVYPIWELLQVTRSGDALLKQPQ